jgi:hypothetical protein
MKKRFLSLLALSLLAFEAGADGLAPDGWFAQAGGGSHSTWAAGAGLLWHWSWRHAFGPGEFSGITEVFASHWKARHNGSREALTQLGVVPLVRYRWDRGRSPWFVEAGIGLTVLDGVYRAEDKAFSTRFNFADVLGAGRSFGPQGRHELGLRLTHYSNGGLRKPNPGENLFGVRYAMMF